MDYCCVGTTPLESEKEALKLIETELDEVAACDSLLGRTEAR